MRRDTGKKLVRGAKVWKALDMLSSVAMTQASIPCMISWRWKCLCNKLLHTLNSSLTFKLFETATYLIDNSCRVLCSPPQPTSWSSS